ncbi:phosphonate C-P lyase system protein PhnG [Hydrogenophaga sp.]|uniref:phosphonate C-P lyase system protein PhnG n=1 Tax=Hydrogenophaga sp. TaxID=1904254 RepID=UPI00271EBBD7|nr:phosphonate C-P lyase system protein PhnG [Hydrogenophaga sp.]MDO9436377.1 phosphonate C-P lyase system protein PhnG [Hydrogenophaga sp.]
MFHAFDNAPPHRPMERTAWMALLARAPEDLLRTALAAHAHSDVRWLRRPETGLMMVQGRAGGTGERFNLGEVTVTRCALRLRAVDTADAPVGVAYVVGRNQRQARLAAVADALLQQPAHQATLELNLLEPIRVHLQQEAAQRHARAQTTKVEFFTVAREAGAGNDEEDDA